MDQETRHTLVVTSHENAGITFVKMQGSLSATTAEQGNHEMKRIVDAGAKRSSSTWPTWTISAVAASGSSFSRASN